MDVNQAQQDLQSLLGRTIKQYRILAILGQGGMGVVYRALDQKLQRPVALKLLAPDVVQDPERRQRFMLEGRTTARVIHPAIAQVYDVDEDHGLIFIAMELVEGSSVRELIERKSLDQLGAIEVALQVAGGLSKAHQAGIIHRDIKSTNVMVTPEGHAKILDFGLVKLLDSDATTVVTERLPELPTIEQTQVGTLKGTPACMSPEQVAGQAVDARSDIFSLGVMLFEMATGCSPFRRGTMVETIHAVVHEEPLLPLTGGVQLSGELRRIIERCLRKKPEDRFASARELMEALLAARRNIESGSRPAMLWQERLRNAVERVERIRGKRTLGVAALVLALAAGTYAIVKGVEAAGFLWFLAVGALVYRRLRHQPRRQLDWLVRKISKLPEVKLISIRERTLTVVIDRPAGQLYERINRFVSDSNARLFFSEPVTPAIRHELPPEEWRRLLEDSGVRFLRDES